MPSISKKAVFREAVNTVITTKTYEQINNIFNKTRTITQKYQTQIKYTHYTRLYT